MLAKLHTEIKYLLLGVALLGGLFYLQESQALTGLETTVSGFMNLVARYGLVGVFIGAIIAQSTVVISVPYTLLVLTVILVRDDVGYLLALSAVAGVGTALGEMFAYTVASNVAHQFDNLSKSGLFRWVRRMANEHPQSAPLIVFGGTASPLPDTLLIVPLAVVNYPLRRLVIPLLTGKVLHSLSIVAMFVFIIGHVEDFVTEAVKVDLTLGILIVSMLVILYQVEKATQTERQHTTA
ncbi:MAG: hypothetical protein GYB65_15135 [Chloroflexi bacterium]|nr:hypothetical protein [Chloroflexota bacterium]